MSEQATQAQTGIGRRRWAIAEGYSSSRMFPIVAQRTRLGSRQSENALMTTIAFPAD